MLEKLIKYFVYATKGNITETQLIKFLYLADLYAVKWTGNQLTELDWYYYNFCLWHEDIDTVLSRMNGKEVAIEREGNETLIKLGVQASNVDNLQLPMSIKLVLDNIRKEWAGYEKLPQLLNNVYNTAPMLEVREKCQSGEKVRLNLLAEREKLMSELG